MTTHTGGPPDYPGSERWVTAPSDLVYAPPRYPAHDYTGDGFCWTVAIDGTLIGRLTVRPPFDPTEVSWDLQLTEDAEDAEQAVAMIVQQMLAEGVQAGTPVADCVREITHTVPLDMMRSGPIDLATLRGEG